MRTYIVAGLMGCLTLLAGTTGPEYRDGGIIRGPMDQPMIALAFTGREFGEGGDTILQQLSRHGARASFSLTGDFLRNPDYTNLVRKIAKGGHYLGPHSDKHLLYCAWETDRKTLVTRDEFRRDLASNLAALEKYRISKNRVHYWFPAYEWYNSEIARWSVDLNLQLVNFTPARGPTPITQEKPIRTADWHRYSRSLFAPGGSCNG
jgi:peptidoglycan/xylan/chitin deacetylase (PgdA/CDA1 family)